MVTTIKDSLPSLFITLLIAFLGGLLCQTLDFPAPFLLGSLFFTFIFGHFSKYKIYKPSIPRWFQLSVLVCMGVLIGGTFNPTIIDSISKWSATIIAMIILTIVATFAGYLYLRKIRNYDHNLAILCSLPGGQAEIVATSIGLVDKDYVVAFCHLVRVSLVFLLTPLLLAFVQGEQGITESNIALNNLSGLFNLSRQVIFQLFFVSITGYGLAHLAGIPMPHLLGPIILSGGLHVYEKWPSLSVQ